MKGGDPCAAAVNQTFKMEKAVKGGDLVLTDIAHKLAFPSVYAKQCVFEDAGSVEIEGYDAPVKLHRLAMPGEMAFLIDKCDRARRNA